MKTKKEFSDYFDDDFEVTYEDDITNTDELSDYNTWDHSHRKNRSEDIYVDSPVRTYISPRKQPVKQKKSRGGIPLAAPIRKGGRTLSRLTAALIRSLTAFLILAIIFYVMWTLWRASTPYGDIMEAVKTMNPSLTLLVYICLSLLFLLFELIALLWSLTKARMRDGSASWKEDTGRGLFSFIAVFILSYGAFILSPVLPDKPEAIYGLKGFLDVYGSMHNVLFGLCAAGTVSCIVRKYFG